MLVRTSRVDASGGGDGTRAGSGGPDDVGGGPARGGDGGEFISPAQPRRTARQQVGLAGERGRGSLSLSGPRERSGSGSSMRLQGGRRAGRDAPKASGGALAPV